MKYFKLTSVAMLLFVSLVSVTDARTVVRSGDTVSISDEQVVKGDLYIAAGDINISGEVEEEVIAAAGEITINGSIKSNAFLIAGIADVYGPVGDDLRIIAGEVTIAEPVTGDVFMMGGTLKILSTASVTGDVLVYAGDVVIEGSVGGDVLGNISTLRIDADIAGDLDVTVGQLTLGDRTNIQGSVRYISASVVVQALNATVVGDLVRSEPALSASASNSWNWLLPSFILLFSGLAWYLVSRKTLSMVTDRAVIKSPRPVLIGLAALIFTPVAIFILTSSLIGALLAGVLFLAYFLLLLFSVIALMPFIGKMLLIAVNKATPTVTLLSLIIGFSGFVLLSLLPVLGQAVVIVLLVILFGGMIDLLIRPKIN